jgi:hypothetical protein
VSDLEILYLGVGVLNGVMLCGLTWEDLVVDVGIV